MFASGRDGFNEYPLSRQEQLERVRTELLEHTVLFDRDVASLRVLDLPRLIQAKPNANRPKDRAVLPLLIATLDERKRQGGR